MSTPHEDNALPRSPILDVQGLIKRFPIRRGFFRKRVVGHVHAVEDVSFHILPGETLGLVGESGCGKSTVARTLVRLQAPTGGQACFEGQDLFAVEGEKLRALRQRIQMIFQDPYASLNPRLRIGAVLREPLHEHGLTHGDSGRALDERIRHMLHLVGLNPDFTNRFPHEFSGGQRQRIGIARALMLEPSLIICDEPISALDVSIQAQIINLLEDLQKKLHIAYLFVAHDLSMIRHISHRVAIMYLGGFVELGTKDEIYSNPLHPYTQAFLSAVPTPDPRAERQRRRILLEGEIPSAINPPAGCRFHTRCRHVREDCRHERPAMRELCPGHFVACHYAGNL